MGEVLPRLTTPDMARTTEARVYVKTNGEIPFVVEHCEDDRAAYRLWLALPAGVKAAFRGAGDTTPVYSHDYVDRM